ncbi:MAG: hypothetical protein IKH98_06135 [Candidatus Methanomethylophilaceae archaeon]|nr:hypothetical protein [Candidatus Methanomethylophilaceae archaeon]
MDGCMRDLGIRDRIVFNAGGSPITQGLADKAGCDVFSTTAVGSVRAIKEEVLRRKGFAPELT